MLYAKKISVVIPCYNEELNIRLVSETLPNYIDSTVVIDDVSSDNTSKIVREISKKDKRMVLIEHEKNQGVGGAIASGYQWRTDNDIDTAVVMAGDGQMDPAELPMLLKPVLVDGINYYKGNRLVYQKARHIILGVRFFGNSVLSLLTKFSSGYWHISDSRCGYTVIDLLALKKIDWDKMYKRYGQPNDLLVTLNIYDFTVEDVSVRPVYNVGEVCGIKIRRVVFTILNILLHRGLERLWLKYVVYDFYPLILFFLFGVLMSIQSVLFFISIIVNWVINGSTPILSSLAFLFSFSFSMNSFFFPMWMDMQMMRDKRQS